jgi:hypothetical protein
MRRAGCVMVCLRDAFLRSVGQRSRQMPAQEHREVYSRLRSLSTRGMYFTSEVLWHPVHRWKAEESARYRRGVS